MYPSRASRARREAELEQRRELREQRRVLRALGHVLVLELIPVVRSAVVAAVVVELLGDNSAKVAVQGRAVEPQPLGVAPFLGAYAVPDEVWQPRRSSAFCREFQHVRKVLTNLLARHVEAVAHLVQVGEPRGGRRRAAARGAPLLAR